MKERGIIFNGEMVRAILDNRKTQTRRVMKVQPVECNHVHWPEYPTPEWKSYEEVWSCAVCGNGVSLARHGTRGITCPFGQPGDRLWVRETSGLQVRRDALGGTGEFRVYRASNPDAIRYTIASGKIAPVKWVPSIHMPRWASRITLEITDVRVERLQDISPEDAVNEGLEVQNFTGFGDEPYTPHFSEPDVYYDPLKKSWTEYPPEAFQGLWQSIYGEASWASNPWCWVIEFKHINKQ